MPPKSAGMASLKDLAALATDAALKQAVDEHITVTQSQADRVTARILALGGDKSEPKGLLNEVLAKASSVLNIFHSHEDKQTQDTIKAYAFEHFEIGAYTSLKAFADAIGDYGDGAARRDDHRRRADGGGAAAARSSRSSRSRP